MTTGRVVFLGAVRTARPVLAGLLRNTDVTVAAVVTAPKRSLPRLTGGVDLARLTRPARVRLIRTTDATDPEVLAAVRELDPDLVVVAGWIQPIGRELPAVARQGCVGFHASLLPAHRGPAPVNWAILRGETITGATMLLFGPDAATGDVVDQSPVAIGPYDDCATVYRRIGEVSARMLGAHLPALLAGTAPRHRLSPHDGDVLPERTPEMGVLDWSQPARAVHDWVRALTLPYPGAFSSISGQRMMIWATLPPVTEPEPAGMSVAVPGVVLGFQPTGVCVATGTGGVVVTQMSAPGEPPEPAVSWCLTHGVRPGMRFEPVPAELARWARGEGHRPPPLRRRNGIVPARKTHALSYARVFCD